MNSGLGIGVSSCLGTRHTEDIVVVADGCGSRWQQKEAGEREEVIGSLLPLSFEVAFGDALSERDWAPQLVLENKQLEWA